jgi:hypothetical protein
MTKKLYNIQLVIAGLLFALSPSVHAVPNGCPVEGAEPMNIGPVNPLNGFPLFVQDSIGLAVELCLDSDGPGTGLPPFCFYDPPDPTNPFSAQIGFGAEGFWAAGDTSIETSSGLDALLVTAVEAAFLTETPVDGEQFPFTRLRIRIDVPQTGIYTVTHPWGQEIFLVDAVDAGQEVRESFDFEFDANTVHQGHIGPMLRWDTFPADPLLDINADGVADYLGDGVTDHAVTGSPCGTNYFRIEAVALDGVTPLNIDPDDIDQDGSTSGVSNHLFTVIGKVFTGVAPAPLVTNRSSYTRQADSNGQVDFFATSAPAAGVTVSGGLNLPPGERPLIGDGNGKFFTSIPLTDASVLPATVNITANNPTNDPNTQITLLTDFVDISLAEYNAATNILSIQATSSDELVPPVLTAFGYGDLAGGSISIPTPAPPAVVTVVSSAGGMGARAVTVISQTATGANPVANSESYLTTEDTQLIVPAPGVLGNDTDAEDGQPVNALLGSNAANGSVVLDINGAFTYTPNLNFNGMDSFTYTARDSNNNLSNLATVTITVGTANDPPVANDDNAATDVDTSVDIAVLANDTDLDGGIDPATVVVTPTTVNGGTAIANAAGVVTYTPPSGFLGTDSFTYFVSDGLGAVSNTATVTVNVNDIAAEIITVLRAQIRLARSEWRIDGNSTVPGPGNSVDIYVGSDTSGTLLGVADVDNLGVWSFRERNSATLPDGATTLTVQSTGGTILTVPLQIR